MVSLTRKHFVKEAGGRESGTLCSVTVMRELEASGVMNLT